VPLITGVSRSTLALLLLAFGLMAAWLAPTRGYHDLNYLPELYATLAVGAMAVVVAGVRVVAPIRVSVLPMLVLGCLLACVVLTLLRGVAVYPELLLAPVMAIGAGLLLVGALDRLHAAGQQALGDRVFCGTVLAGALLTAWTVLVQARLLSDLGGWVIVPPVGTVPFSNFYQRNLGALLMSLGVVALWGGSAAVPSVGVRCAQMAGTLVLALALALTQSRAGVVLPLLGVLCLGLGRWRNVVLPLLSVAACQGVVLWMLQQGLVAGALADAHSGVQRLAEGEGLSMRLQIMLHGLRQWSDYPVWGGGWGSHPGWLYLHAENLSWPRYSTHTHQLVSQLLGETGLLGFLPVAAASAMMAVRLLRKRPWKTDSYASAHVAVVVVILAHSMVEYPLWNTYFLIPFLWSLVRLTGAVSTATSAVEWAQEGVARGLRWGGVVLLVVGGLCLWGLLGAVDERLLAQARYAAAGRPATPPVLGSSYFSDVIRYADPVTDTRLAALRRPLGERLAATAPMDWILERLAVDQALVGDATASATTFVRLCAMYRHRCPDVLARLEGLEGRADLFVPIRAEVLRRVRVRHWDDYDLPLIR
jgi:Virulence factor membrane-bound polymerase, C-terminal/O-Antigen ligase